MTRGRRGRRPAAGGGRPVPRTARLNELIREIVADGLRSIDDERLEHVSITAVDVDSELTRAVVFFDSIDGPDGDPVVLEALSSHRVRLQRAIGDQMRARRTPVLEFRPDEVIRSAERIDAILRQEPPEEPGAGPA